MEANHFEFAAIRGIQAGAAYYVIMCPLRQLARLLRFDDEALPADLRAQRVLNKARVPVIARYVAENPREYILSALCASVDGDLEFVPAAAEGPLRAVGKLRIGMSATLLINDGQHRRAALEEAVRERPLLGDETVSIVVFADRGLARSQQMFADLNSHALRPTKSIRLLYDHRDAMAGLVRRVVEGVPLLRDFTSLDTSSISNRSLKLFTLSSLHQATVELLGRPATGRSKPAMASTAIAFWGAVVDAMPDWQAVARRDVAASELRRETVHAHGVAVQAIGHAGRELLRVVPDPEGWRGRLPAIGRVNWSRSNRNLWEGRALLAGRVNKSRSSVLLIGNVLLRAMDLPLTAEGEAAERAYRAARPRDGAEAARSMAVV